MARWLLAGIFSLVAVFSLSITLTRAIGQAWLLDSESIFTRPDGTPCSELCLFGVLPGQTTADEAAAILRAHPLIREFELIGTQPFRVEGHGDWIMMISFNTTPDGIVDEITLARYIRYGRPAGEKVVALPDPGTLGDAMSRFGSPDFVQLSRGFDPSLIFTDAGVIANLVRSRGEAGRITLDQPLSRLTLFRRDKCDEKAFDSSFLRWLGAAQLRRYVFSYGVTRTVRRMNSAGTTFAPCQN